MKKAIAAVLTMLTLAACGQGKVAAPEREDVIEDGRAIAEAQCASCHGVERGATASPRPDAPPFPRLFQHYSAPVLAEEFVEGVKVGHPDMPEFQMDPKGADSLVAYIQSIQER